VFIGTTRCLWHEHPVLSQGRGLLLALTDRCLVFDIALSHFCGRAPAARNANHFERVGQSLAYQIYLVSTLNARAWRRSLAVDFHMAPDYCRGRKAARFEESAAEQPSIDAQ
jgi:hypothetical protein